MLMEGIRSANSDDIRFLPPAGDTLWPPVSAWQFRHWEAFLKPHGWTDAQIAQYTQHDRFDYGFGLRHTERDPWMWFYQPTPRAVSFHASKVPNILYGGAAGGSKSHSARWDAYRHCWSIPGFVAIIMRRTFQELKRNHMRFVAQESERINTWLGKDAMNFIPTEFELRFPHNGSLIIFGHCQNPGDEEKYLSDEYDAFYPDEIATFTKEQVLGVASRLRSTKRGIHPRLGATSNPGGAHTLWCVQYFITRDVDRDENPRYNPQEWAFIPARLYDNPYLMDADGTFTTYENRLYARGEMRRRQLLDGDWTAIVGQFFPEFSDRHILHLDIPAGTRIERWIDWGYSKPGVCHWVACLSNGHLHVFREYLFRQTVASDVARHIVEETRDVLRQIPQARLAKSVADPSMFSLDGHTGESYAETFGRCGVPLIKGDNQRVLGWGRLRHWLQNAPDGLPWLTFDPSCTYTHRTIPSLISDKNDPEDVDTEGEDHAADADRYGVMARPAPTDTVRPRKEYLPDTVGWWLNTLQQRKERPIGKVS